MRSMTRRTFIAAALCCIAAGSLTGCKKSDIAGKTLYSVSAWSCSYEDPGDVTRIVFDEGNEYHYTGGKDEDTGTWMDGDEGIVLTSATSGGVTTLNRKDDGSYAVAGENAVFGTRFFLDEDDAKTYSSQFVTDAPKQVSKILESSTFSGGDGGWKSQTKPEEIDFTDGKLNYQKGEYTQDGYFFHQGPDDDDWLSSDHSGKYKVTVTKMVRNGYGGKSDWPSFRGTLAVGDTSTDFVLDIKSDESVVLTIGQVKFTATK